MPRDLDEALWRDFLRTVGPLRPLIEDDTLSEIMVNGPDMVYVESGGKIVLTDIRFEDMEEVLATIKIIVEAVGRQIDEESPMCDARLLDGSRVNAVISPVALDGPFLTIRKFSKDPYQATDLISFGTLTVESAAFLSTCVLAKLTY